VKVGEVNLGDQWVGTKTELIIARVDYHMTKQWDALLERRVQRQRESDTSQSGFLGGLFYKFNKHVKVGAGYNWSHFDDDLTTIEQDSKGWFVNIVSAF
jgi:opacity protein-like surface antigen